METISVQSQMIATLSYDRERRGEGTDKPGVATVLFKRGGATWEYWPVAPELWISWKASDSKGGFFVSHLKNNPDIKQKRVDR